MTDVTSGKFTQTPEEIEFEMRAAISSQWTGGRLFIGMYAFLMASLAFSYFYLRSSNNGQLWRPNHVSAPTSIGWAIASTVVLAAFLALFGHARLRRGRVLDWEVAGWIAVACGLGALALQCWELTDLSFYPGSSGYASCFIGWAVLNIITILLMTYWLETALARSLRLRSEYGTGAQLESTESARMFRANVASCTYFCAVVAVSSALFFSLFYLL